MAAPLQAGPQQQASVLPLPTDSLNEGYHTMRKLIVLTTALAFLGATGAAPVLAATKSLPITDISSQDKMEKKTDEAKPKATKKSTKKSTKKTTKKAAPKTDKMEKKMDK